jgi:arylsulfatase B
MDHWEHTQFGVHDFHENGKPIYPQGHSTDLYADKVSEILRGRSKDKPFFMCLALNAPHVPLQTHNEFVKKYNFGNQNRNIFAGMVTHMDKKIGDLIQTLKDLGQYDDTIIWFTSDNGGWLGDFGGTNFPLKDGKISFYEGGIRVVNIAKMPISEKRISKVCHASDIFPTLCDLVGVDRPSVDGVSVLLPGKDRELAHHYRRISEDKFVGCIRSGDWKYMTYKNEELYNIAEDPVESKNLASQETEILRTLKVRLKSFESIYKKEKFDLAWFPPHGPPPGFKMPKCWSPSKNLTRIKMLQTQDTREDLSMREALGLYS